MSRLLYDAFDTDPWTDPEPGGAGHYPVTLDPPNATETTATYDLEVSAIGYILPVTVRVTALANLEVRNITVDLDPISLPVIPPPPEPFPARPMRSANRLWNPQG